MANCETTRMPAWASSQLSVDLEGLERLLYHDLRSGKRAIPFTYTSVRREVREQLALLTRRWNEARSGSAAETLRD